MAEYFKEPQNPLKKIDETTGDITYVYPLTTAKQVIMDDDGTRLNTILNENILYLGDAEDEMSVALVDADTLDGIPASEYAKKEDLENIDLSLYTKKEDLGTQVTYELVGTTLYIRTK